MDYCHPCRRHLNGGSGLRRVRNSRRRAGPLRRARADARGSRPGRTGRSRRRARTRRPFPPACAGQPPQTRPYGAARGGRSGPRGGRAEPGGAGHGGGPAGDRRRLRTGSAARPRRARTGLRIGWCAAGPGPGHLRRGQAGGPVGVGQRPGGRPVGTTRPRRLRHGLAHGVPGPRRGDRLTRLDPGPLRQPTRRPAGPGEPEEPPTAPAPPPPDDPTEAPTPTPTPSPTCTRFLWWCT